MDTEPPSCVYDAAIVMAKFIQHNFDVKDKTIVELGAGCGFTACHLGKLQSASQSKSKVIATDLDSVVPLIQRNLEKNQVQSKVTAMPLFWGNKDHLEQVKTAAGASVDLIFGADILFDFDNFDGLFDIFDQLSKVFVPKNEEHK